MKRRMGHIGRIMLLLILGGMLINAGICFAKADSPSPHELALLDRINQARQNPLEAARELGLNPDQVRADFPELHTIFSNGLPPLSFNDKLYHAAKAHTEDMLDRQYYARVSPEGKTPEQRILESGYIPLTTAETIGFVGFNNFIAPEEAVNIIFKNIFLDELRQGRMDQRNLLNPDLKEVGINIDADAFQVQGTLTNVYVSVLDFGAGADKLIEASILRLLNEARRDPLIISETFSETAARTDLEVFEWEADQWIPPLASHPILQQTAKNQNKDIIRRIYYDTNTPEGLTPMDRAEIAGYEARKVFESLSVIVSDSYIREPIELARILFQNMIEDELAAYPQNEMNLLDSELTEAGIGFDSAVFNLNGQPKYVYLAVADMAQPVHPKAYLIGNVYRESLHEDSTVLVEDTMPEYGDLFLPVFGYGDTYYPRDPDSGFDIGEGIGNMTVHLKSINQEEVTLYTTESDTFGGYQIELPDGYSKLFLKDKNGKILKSWFMFGKNINYLKDLPLN